MLLLIVSLLSISTPAHAYDQGNAPNTVVYTSGRPSRFTKVQKLALGSCAELLSGIRAKLEEDGPLDEPTIRDPYIDLLQRARISYGDAYMLMAQAVLAKKEGRWKDYNRLARRADQIIQKDKSKWILKQWAERRDCCNGLIFGRNGDMRGLRISSFEQVSMFLTKEGQEHFIKLGMDTLELREDELANVPQAVLEQVFDILQSLAERGALKQLTVGTWTGNLLPSSQSARILHALLSRAKLRAPLTHLGLREMDLRDTVYATMLRELPRLSSLSFEGSAITEAGIEFISTLSGITQLSLRDAVLDGEPIDNAIAARLGRMKQLTHLDLNGHGLNEVGLRSLFALSNLVDVKLGTSFNRSNSRFGLSAKMIGLLAQAWPKLESLEVTIRQYPESTYLDTIEPLVALPSLRSLIMPYIAFPDAYLKVLRKRRPDLRVFGDGFYSR